jgi:hypothetical protein
LRVRMMNFSHSLTGSPFYGELFDRYHLNVGLEEATDL